ncbi:MAG: hypothetical protein HQL29_01175 [Candidatus Omnitrophica bacterium]|nr:hypothetical protein [Candidatus Omnitrophota bacterium]
MAKIIIVLVAAYFSFQIFKNKGNYKSLLWVIVGMMLLHKDLIVTENPLSMPITRWLIYSILFTQILYNKHFIRDFRTFPLTKSLLVFLACSFIIAIFDSRLSFFDKFYIPFYTVCETCFLLFVGYLAIRTPQDINKMSTPLLVAIIVVTFYAIFQYLTRYNPYHTWVMNNFFAGGEAEYISKMRVLDIGDARTRMNSTFSTLFQYGFFSSMLALLFLFFYTSKRTYKWMSLIGFICGVIGVVLCASRSVMLSFMIALSIFVSRGLNIKKFFQYALILGSLGLFAYWMSPELQESVDVSLDVFQGGTKVPGSSMAMRESQFSGAYYYMQKSPIIGNGYKYIYNELGWGDRDRGGLDKEMYGFESIVYELMIEQGIIGLFSTFFILSMLLIYFMKKRKINKSLAELGFAMTLFFVMFAVATGPLGNWPITMLLLGSIIKTLVLLERTEQNAQQLRKVI